MSKLPEPVRGEDTVPGVGGEHDMAENASAIAARVRWYLAVMGGIAWSHRSTKDFDGKLSLRSGIGSGNQEIGFRYIFPNMCKS
jgi:hypothetical protein